VPVLCTVSSNTAVVGHFLFLHLGNWSYTWFLFDKLQDESCMRAKDLSAPRPSST